MRIAILLILLLINNCSKKSNLKDFTPHTYKIDTTLINSNIKLIATIALQENDSTILRSVVNCCFNPEKELLVITDMASKKLILYKLSNGQLIRSASLPWIINDSVALSGQSSYNYSRLSWKYILYDDYKLFNIDLDKEIMHPFYAWVSFLNKDTLVASGISYVPVYSSLGDITLASEPVFLFLDNELNILETMAPENKDNNSPSGLQFSIIPGSEFFVISCNGNNDEFISYRFDSIETLSIYNKDGQYISPLSYLPYTYTANYLGTSVVHFPYYDFINDVVFIGFPYCDTIFTNNNKALFKLKNIPFDNWNGISYFKKNYEPYYKNFKTTILPEDSGYVFRKKWMEMYREKEKNFKISPESFHELVPISISGIFRIKDNIMIWLMIKDKDAEMGYYYFLQEYKSDGTLVKYLKIEDNTKEKLQYVTFDNSSDKLVMFKKTKKNIVMENYKWE